MADINGTLNLTLEDTKIDAYGSRGLRGTLNVVLEDTKLEAFGARPLFGELEVTLDDTKVMSLARMRFNTAGRFSMT